MVRVSKKVILNYYYSFVKKTFFHKENASACKEQRYFYLFGGSGDQEYSAFSEEVGECFGQQGHTDIATIYDLTLFLLAIVLEIIDAQEPQIGGVVPLVRQ